jgi:lipopolysaccharide transport system ATP-binding protein
MENVSENKEVMIQLSGAKKKYRLGQIGGETLQADLQSWWARIHGKEDPNSKIGADQRSNGETFMALNGIDLTIYKGEAVGIIGSNGAGKSTLLKLLSRVTAPTEGEIDIYGRIASMLEVGTGFSPEMTGRENVYMNGTILGMTKAEIDAKMEDIIEFSEVREFIDTPVKRYSSGMYVKLAFSVAAHLDSEIMIMDEVLAVGDMAFQKKCLDKMRDAAKKEGRTVLYVSHNMNTIRQLCDRCIVLDRGRVVFDGEVEKGILQYLGGDNELLPRYYDLQTIVRPSTQHGKRIRLLSFEFINKETAIFDSNEEMKFMMKFKANESIEDVKAFFVINNSNGQIVGMTQTKEPIVSTCNGKEYCYEGTFNISNLAKGRYFFEIDIFSDDGEGRHWSYDHPRKNIVFEILEDEQKGLIWQNKYFGSVRLNEVRKVDVKELP